MSELPTIDPEVVRISCDPELDYFVGAIETKLELLEHDDQPLVVREVTPEDRIEQPSGSMVIMHGFTQLAHEGPSAALQETLALEHPELRVLAIETDYMGEFSEDLSKTNKSEYFAHTLEAMAERRLEYFQRISSNENPLTLVGTSMGAVITVMALDLARQRGVDLHIENVVFNDSAVIPEKGVKRIRKLAAFPIHMAWSVPLELARAPKHASELAKTGWHALSNAGRKDIVAMSRQVYDLAFGDSHPDIDRLVKIFEHFSDTQIIFLSGVNDPLRTPKVYSRIARELRNKGHSNVHVKRVGLSGHARSVNYIHTAESISWVLARYNESFEQIPEEEIAKEVHPLAS